MSIRHVAWVLDHSRAEHGARLVMVVLAEHANDEDVAYPSVETVSRRAKLSPRSVQYALRSLVEIDELEALGESQYETTRYRLQGCRNCGGAKSDTGGVQNEASQIAPEPTSLFEPTTEPPRAALVEIVWSHYQRVIPGASRQTLDSTRRTIILNALKVRDAQACKKAIDGLSRSPHHNGQNDRLKKYLGIRYALAGLGKESIDERIDKMAELAGTTSVGASIPSGQREIVRERQRHVVEWHKNPGDDRMRATGERAAAWLKDTLGLVYDGSAWTREQK